MASMDPSPSKTLADVTSTANAFGDPNSVDLKPMGKPTHEPFLLSPPTIPGSPLPTNATSVGKIAVPVEITVKNLTVTAVGKIPSKKNKDGTQGNSTVLIRDVTMHVPSGHLMAIMGNAKVDGEILFNGEPPRRFLQGGSVAYVQQQDSLLPYLTVRDTLRYAARLRLPRTMSIEEKDAMVESVILELGLKECANTLMAMNGERVSLVVKSVESRKHRTPTLPSSPFLTPTFYSVGVQLLLNPSVIFMDEPPPVSTHFPRVPSSKPSPPLRNPFPTIIISIHQPRSDIFTAFTHITLLASRGRLAYSGTRLGAITHLAALGHTPGENVNGADFLIDVTTVDNRSLEAEKESGDRVEAVVNAWKVVQETLKMEDVREAVPGSSHGDDGRQRMEQVWVLTGRVLANMREDRLTLWGSILEVCALQNYLGLMFITYKLCSELVVFDRERADKMYSVPAYLYLVIIYFMTGLRTDNLAWHFGLFAMCGILMQLNCNFVFLCVIVEEFCDRLIDRKLHFTFLSLSSGFFLPLTAIPIYLRWIQHVSYITYGLRIFATVEFENRVYSCPGLPPGAFACRGESAFSQLGMTPGIVVPFVGLVSLFLGFMLLTTMCLQFIPQGGTKQAGKVNSGAPPPPTGKIADEAVQETIAVDKTNPPPPQITVTLDKLSLSFVHTPPLTRLGLTKSPATTTPILQSLTATFRPSTLTAILGASGAGKSTLLHLLHSRTPHLPAFTRPHTTGTLLHNSTPLTPTQIQSLTASVRQDDSHLLPALTARETLIYASLLRLPISPHPPVARVPTLSSGTSVSKTAPTPLSAMKPSKVSVAVKNVAKRLDASTASNMVRLLKRIASSGRTVICTIHQPRSDLFPIFDNILLLARPGPNMLTHLTTMGHPVPPLTNPADFALDISSIDLRNTIAEKSSRDRVTTLIQSWSPPPPPTPTPLPLPTPPPRLPFIQTLPLLISRSFLNLRRQPALILLASVTGRLGFLQQTTALVFIGMLNCIAVFPQELRLFKFERMDGACSVEAFFWTYTVNECHALGSLIFAFSPANPSAWPSALSSLNPVFSVQIMSAVISIMTIMAGFLSVNMPVFLDRLNYVSLMRYAARAQAVDEFRGLKVDCEVGQPGAICKGEDVLELLGFVGTDEALRNAVIAMVGCMVCYRQVFASMEDGDMLGLLEKTQKAVKALQDGNGDDEELGTYLEKLKEYTGTEENAKTLVIAGLLPLTIETTQTIMTSPNHHLLETCLTILSNIFCFPTITHTLPTLHTAFRLGCIVASSITTPLFVHEAGVSVCNNIAWMCRDVGVVGMLKEEGVLETLLVVFVNQEEVAGSGVAGLLGVNLTLMEGAIGEEAVIELLEHSACIYVAFMVDVLPLYQDLTDASMKKLECFVEWTHRLYSMRLKREFTIDLEKLFQIVFAILGRLPMDIIATPNGNMESWEVDEEMEERKRDFVGLEISANDLRLTGLGYGDGDKVGERDFGVVVGYCGEDGRWS
ncbi:hypothetical protein BC829DRAFT_440776 [Chytridium lagenaria]|nr:hypothetical protein BC829DRAFT_440776 [Chytridium lagenaria]